MHRQAARAKRQRSTKTQTVTGECIGPGGMNYPSLYMPACPFRAGRPDPGALSGSPPPSTTKPRHIGGETYHSYNLAERSKAPTKAPEQIELISMIIITHEDHWTG